MKKNTFFLLVGIIALIELAIFWISIETRNPLLIQIAVVAGIIIIYLLKRTVEKGLEDERTQFIAQKSAFRTLEIFWVVFFVMSLSSIVFGFSEPLGINPPRMPPRGEPLFPPELLPADAPRAFGIFGFAQLALLCLMIFLYVAFRFYYGRKYGEWDADEE